MWGFTIYLIRLADYLYGRRYKNKKCDICGKKFGSIDTWRSTGTTSILMP